MQNTNISLIYGQLVQHFIHDLIIQIPYFIYYITNDNNYENEKKNVLLHIE